MSEEKNSQQAGQQDTAKAESVFWISTFPFFDTTLYVLPDGEARGEESSTFLTIYDPDGAEINHARLDLPVGEVNKIDLNMFLGGCKLESGMTHAVVILQSSFGTKHMCCIKGVNGETLLGKLREFSNKRSAFLPYSFSEKVQGFIPLVNLSDVEAQVKCRLFCGAKNPDVEVTIPGHATRIIAPNVVFPEFFEANDGGRKFAYLRFSSRSDALLGVQLIECNSVNEICEYSSIC